MTDQPAAPTPGPYRLGGSDFMAPLKDMTFNSPLNIVSERSGVVVYIASMHANGDIGKRIANAKLLAASWATAAERDRLKVVIGGCVKALERLVSDQHEHPVGCLCPWCNARTALDEARKP